jgi:hypothetical protein
MAGGREDGEGAGAYNAEWGGALVLTAWVQDVGQALSSTSVMVTRRSEGWGGGGA